MEWGIAVVCLVLVLASAYDIKTRLIPNIAVAILIVLRLVMFLGEFGVSIFSSSIGLVFAAIAASFVQSFVVIVCLLVLSLMMDKLLGRPSFGMGDIKLIGALILFLPTNKISSFLWLACIAMMLTALIFAVRKKNTFPCAPAISVGFVAEALFNFGL